MHRQSGATPHDRLADFHPLVGAWFAERVGRPTDVQDQAWARIAAGEHVLITAPTGSGKTLAAFLWALDRLIARAWTAGQTRVLYVSPLKALNNDVQRNLLAPLAELRVRFDRAGVPFPHIDVVTRSGDTAQADRRRMLRHPPEILITTPESLNILLSSTKARSLFAGLETVILDEIHAVASTKRGTHLMTAVDRLVPLAGEFQRVALSATVRPLDRVADFVGGYEADEIGGETRYRKRDVAVIEGTGGKEYALSVRAPAAPPAGGTVWHALAEECRRIIERNRATLVFANSRRLCERICMFINESAGRMTAYAHHGSLSRETRFEVEQRLKRGDLDAIVSTNSLELGIDIGSLDEVVLIETPPSVASCIQRLGRAGHRVGEASRGVLFPTHGRDYLDAAVMARSVADRDIETVEPVLSPLDVLAQVVVSMTAVETWTTDALYAFLRSSYPFHTLRRNHFDLVLEMLAGRYAETRLRDLESLVMLDRIEGTVRAKDSSLRVLYASGGTIPDRGYFTLRRFDSKAKIGELDEEFVWERANGDSFTLGAQTWQIRQVTHSDVFVEPGRSHTAFIPFWRAEEARRGFPFAERAALFLETANDRLGDPAFKEDLVRDHHMTPEAADALVGFLARQRAATGTDLPHRHHLLVERFHDHLEEAGMPQVVFHTLWGGTVNRPLALAQAYEDRHGHPLEVQSNDDVIVAAAAPDVGAEDLLGLVRPEDLEDLLRKRLESTGFFGARFRENAARALLLPRKGFNRRMPLWVNRLRAKRLMESVLVYPDFPILVETWRTCLRDEFDLDSARRVLRELRDGAIRVGEVRTPAPSPFCSSLVWQQTNRFLYMDDTPASGRASGLTDQLIREVLFSSDLRPRIDPDLAETFSRKLRRLAPGYAPQTPEELLDWVRERLFIPEDEWADLEERVPAEDGDQVFLEPVAHKLVRVGGPQGGGIVALESAARFAEMLDPGEADALDWEDLLGDRLDPEHLPLRTPREGGADDREALLEAWLAEWLRFYGPVPERFPASVLPMAPDRLARALEALAEDQVLVRGALLEGSDAAEICDADNLEILLRLARADRRPDVETRSAADLPLFLARHQGLTDRAAGPEGLRRALEPLLACPFAVAALETDLLPARVSGYTPAVFDGILQETGLQWVGCGDKRAALAFPELLDLLPADDGEGGDADALFPDRRGRYTFSDLIDHTGKASGALSRLLWEQVWQGRVSNDSFAAVRHAIEHKFRAAEAPSAAEGRPSRRAGFQRWKATRPFSGHWYLLSRPQADTDPLDRDEANKDRVRILLDRYGVLFRELLQRELPPFRWGPLFRTLRLLELGGELVSGSFFEGVPGLQFASPAAVRALRQPLPDDVVYWVNADDPASLCGIDVAGLKAGLPKRVDTTHLVYHGRDPVLVSRRAGKAIDLRVGPDHPRLDDYFVLFRDLLGRAVRPMPSVAIETVNDTPAPHSPYLDALRRAFDVAIDPKRVTLYHKHGTR